MSDISSNVPQASSVAIDLVELTAEIVGAFIAYNSVPLAELSDLIASVHGALAGLGHAAPDPAPATKPTPPVSIRKSVTDDHLISLEDGKAYKALRRHLGRLRLTPEAYRAKWGLPHDYPMVAPAYARRRSELAKSLGLGQLRRKR